MRAPASSPMTADPPIADPPIADPVDAEERVARIRECWRAALNTDDPAESRKWVALAEALGHRPADAAARPVQAGERRRFPRVPVETAALLTVADRVLAGHTRNLSRTGAGLALADGHGVLPGDMALLTVAGWVADRPARVVAVDGPIVRLAYA